MFKKMALLSLSLFITNIAVAAQLSSYQDVVDAINDGKTVKVVADWDACQVNVPDVKPNFISSYTFENPNIEKAGFVQSWGTRFTYEIKSIPQLGSVKQSYVYTINQDGSLAVINRFLDPVTYAEKMPPVKAICQLNVGYKVFAN